MAQAQNNADKKNQRNPSGKMPEEGARRQVQATGKSAARNAGKGKSAGLDKAIDKAVLKTARSIRKGSLSGDNLKIYAKAGAVQIFVLANGLILSIAAYIILNMFIQGMVAGEQKRLVEDTQNKIVADLSHLDSVLRAASTILITSRPMGDESARRNVLYGVPALSRFERVFWLRHAEGAQDLSKPESWVLQDILKQESKSAAASLELLEDKDIIAHVLKIYNRSNERIVISSDIEGLRYTQAYANPTIYERPFMLAQTMLPGTQSETVIVALTRPTQVLDREWLDSRAGIGRLAIRDVELGHGVFFIDRMGLGSEETLTVNNSAVLEFPVAGQKWRLLIDVRAAETVGFLASTPLILLLFGLALTAVGTLYVWTNQRQSLRMKALNKTLAQKNYELNSEVLERERLNDVLSKTEGEYRAIIDSVSDILFEAGSSGEILFLNTTWRKVTGFEVEQTVARNIFDFLHPQDVPELRESFLRIVKGQLQSYRGFTRLRTLDGTYRSVELAMAVLRQDENRNNFVVGTLTDVEERRRAEKALSEAEQNYRAIVEHAAGGIYQMTTDGRFLSANPAMARILNYDSPAQLMREIENAHDTIYVNPKERGRFIRDLETIGIVKNFEIEARTRNGEHIWVNENARAVRDDEGHILYLEGSMENISQRKQAEMKLREAKISSDLASRAKSEFLANMSHELRTPLNAIIGFSEIIKNEVLGKIENRQYWEYARDIYDSGTSLLHIINEILDVARIEAGERQLNESNVNVDKLVKDCLSFVQPKAEAGKLTIVNMMDKAVPNLIVEELALKQALINILSNAIKFTPEGGRVTLAHEIDSEGQIRISVTDTGIGLDEGEIQKALSPFGQVETSLNRTGSGTGLTLVDSLMKLHGGRLELFSQKGMGTTATLIFPARRVMQEQGSRRWQP